MTSKYADWSPVSVFGSTRTSSMATSSLPGSLGSRVVVSKNKTSPKKRDPVVNSLPQTDVVVSNNDEDDKEKSGNTQHRRSNSTRVERKRELAALLLQRQVQVWLLRRQENLRRREVQRLRGELHTAVACVIRESYTRYVKRRAIGSYLREVGRFETRLDVLLQGCVRRKRQLEELQRFAALRRQQKQVAEEQKREFIRDWLRLCVQTRHKKREQAIATAREKLIGWIRRRMLRKRCEARVSVREKERLQDAHRRSSAKTIVAFYRSYKRCLKVKEVARNRSRMRDSLTKLCEIYYLDVLRAAQSRWHTRVLDLTMAHEAASRLQRVYRVHQATAKHARVVACAVTLQRMIRGHCARVRCEELKQSKLQDATNRQRLAAATVIQQHVRGHLARLWFRDVLYKLRERFRCANCGAIEPGGAYCKYCGRHRTSSGLLSSVLMLHERWQLGKSSWLTSKTMKEDPVLAPNSSMVTVPSPKKPTFVRSRSASLRMLAASSSSGINLQVLTPLPEVVSPRHRRLIARVGDTLPQSNSIPKNNLVLPRRSSISSIGEQTALRAAALADLQAAFTASAQSNVLEMHISRLHKGITAINRGTTNHRPSQV